MVCLPSFKYHINHTTNTTHVRIEPATAPPTSSFTLLIPLPHFSPTSYSRASRSQGRTSYFTVDIVPSSSRSSAVAPSPYIRCIDVFLAVSSKLRERSSRSDYEELSQRGRELVNKAFWRRIGSAPGIGGEREREKRVGMRKVDMMGGWVIWGGVKRTVQGRWVLELAETRI